MAILSCSVNEVEYLVRHLVTRIEEHLILLVNPVEGQISNADTFPHVAHGISRAVDYMRYFVSSDKFQVLTTRFSIVFSIYTIYAHPN